MDRLTYELYGPGRPYIEWEGSISGQPPANTASAIEAMIGPSPVADPRWGEEIASVCACPRGAFVRIDGYRDESEAFVSVESSFEGDLGTLGQCRLSTRLVLLAKLGEPAVCRGEYAAFAPPGMGLGIRFFGMLTERLRDAGFSRFTCEAAGSPGSRYNGYYTWASFGADLALPEDLAEKAQSAGFPFTRSSHELFRHPGGQRWWLENGRTAEASFELAEGSRHTAILRTYMKLKGVQLN